MIEKYTKELIQHGYTTTVALYPLREDITVAYSHITSSDLKFINHQSIRNDSYIFYGGYSVYDNLHPQKDRMVFENDDEEPVFLDNYMNELYKLYQRGNQHSQNEEKFKFFFEESLSKELTRIVMMGEERGNYDTLVRERVDDNHYIVVVPSDWTDRKIAAENILRPIFIDAGLVKSDDPLCRLIFVDTLSAIFYSYQKHLSDPAEKRWLEYGTMKKNKHYALFDMNFAIESNVASIACYLFQTGNTNSMVNGVEVFQPHNVSCSSSGKIDLVSAYTIKNNLLGLLYNKKILPVQKLSSSSSESYFYDRLLKKMIQIASAYYFNSKSDNNDFENKDGKSSISQMPLQRPFRNLDFRNYIKLTRPQSEALEEINMEELYSILFCENETRIKKYTEDCLKKYRETLQVALLTKGYPGWIAVFLKNKPYISDCAEKRDSQYQKHADHDSNKKITVDKASCSADANNYYIKPIFCIIRSCTEKYFSFMATDVEKLQFFTYGKTFLLEDLLSKIQDDVRNSLKFLPPSTIHYPISKYTSILESTKKTKPKYIFNIDLSLQGCKYLFVQADKDTKEEGTKVDYKSKAIALNVSSLNRFIKVESHASASLHISQKMLRYLLKLAHFQATLDYFAKYDRKVLRGCRDLHEYEEVCDEEDTNHLKLPSPFYFSLYEKSTIIPTIEKLFKKHDDTSKKKPIIIVRRPNYIMAFIVIYLVYIKRTIDANLKKHGKDASGEISYVVSVDKILLDKCLMGSKSILKELLIASGITNKSTIRKQIRVITQGECSFPIMQKKAKLELPLKAYYVHAQLYESSIQLTLNQVVKKEPYPMTIIIKSDIILIKHMHELLCDNIWNQIQSNCHKSVCEEHRVDRNKNLKEEREYSMADRLEFEESFMKYVRNLPSLKESTDFEGLKVPKGDNSCNCSVYLTHVDLVELSIKPILKTIVSSILSTLTNDQIFGEYYIFTLFVTFDSILNSVFHYSYKDLLKSILRNNIKRKLEIKQLEIPYFVFLESDYAEMIETRNRTFSNLFSEGSLLQVSSATYVLQPIKKSEVDEDYYKPGIYTKDPKTLKLYRVSKDYSSMITILERGDGLLKEGGIKKTFYLGLEEFSGVEFRFDLFKLGSNFSQNSIDDDEVNPSKASSDLSYLHSLYKSFCNCRYEKKLRYYLPLYITIKPIGYQSSIDISFDFDRSIVIRMGDPLTLRSTQYMPRAKKEDLTEN